jgi:uncharacterized protein YjbI with pentapeptide repeats
MSEEPQAGQQPNPFAWGQPIAEARQAELDALASQQADWSVQPAESRGSGPLWRVSLTGADVFWLAKRALAGPQGDMAAAETRLRTEDFIERQSLNLAALHLEGADLRETSLERAIFRAAHLEQADLSAASLAQADFSAAHLEQAIFRAASLERADLTGAHLEGAVLRETHLEGAALIEARLEMAYLSTAHLEGAHLNKAHLSGAVLREAHLEGADLPEAHLEGRAYAADDADWLRVRQVFPDFPQSLPAADLREAFFDKVTMLRNVTFAAPTTDVGVLSVGPRVADVRWGDVNLALIDWFPLIEHGVILGDEREARDWQPEPYVEQADVTAQSEDARLDAERAHAERQQRQGFSVWAAAARANRQFATALRDQGMSDEADYFAYRAQVVQRAVWRRRRKWGRWLFSGFLDLLAGYGYKAERSLSMYFLVLAVFTALYLLASNGWLSFGLPRSTVHPFQWYEALVLSVSSFHGRGFFQSFQSPSDPIAILAAIEAVCGLIIEISFIATFTQRYFSSR